MPASRSGLNSMKGYLRVEGWMSVSSILSSSFLRLVACLDLEALAEKRAMKSLSSLILASLRLLVSRAWRSASWLDSYQKS